MRKHKKLALNIGILFLLVIFLAGVNGIRLSAKSAALQAGKTHYFTQAVASIVAYEEDYALVMLKQKENAACYVVKQELNALWKATGYGTRVMDISETQDKDVLIRNCMFWLSKATNTRAYDVLFPVPYMEVYDWSIQGKIYPIYEVNPKEVKLYHETINLFMNSDKGFNQLLDEGIKVIEYIGSNGQSSLQLLDPRQAQTSLVRDDEILHLYLTSQVNPNRNMSIRSVYTQTQAILTELVHRVKDVATIDELQRLNWQSIIEDILDEMNMQLEFGSFMTDPSIYSNSKFVDIAYTDIKDFAKQEKWAYIETEFTVSELSRMTKKEMKDLLNILASNVLIQAKDDQYIRLLASDVLPLDEEKVKDTNILIGVNFNEEDTLKQILDRIDYQEQLDEINKSFDFSISSHEDMLTYQAKLKDLIAERFGVDASKIEVALVSQYLYK